MNAADARDVGPVAYRHLMDDGWEYFDAESIDGRCPNCVPLYEADVLDRLRAENEALRARLRWHIRVYRVSDDHADPEAFADELLARELTPNAPFSGGRSPSAGTGS